MKSRLKTSSTGRKPVIVLFQGSFDLLNWGHIKCFEMAKANGDYLIVALNSNTLIKSYKDYPAILPYYQRRKLIASIRFVDKVVKATEMSPIKLLKRYKVDVYVVAEEWKMERVAEIAYIERRGGKVVYTPRWNGVVSSGDIKKKLIKETNWGNGR